MKVLISAILVFTVIATLPYSLVYLMFVLFIVILLKLIKRELKSSEAMKLNEEIKGNNSVATNHNIASLSTGIDSSRQIYDVKSSADRQEDLVSYFLNTLDKDLYTVINDVTVPSNGSTSNTQIDHVVVSRYGIFCIETKSHKGWIFGSDNQTYWTQVLYNKHYRFYSPLRQNFAHVLALKSLLGINLKYPIVSIVVFSKADKISVSGDGNVGDIVSMIERIKKNTNIVYDPYECERIVNSINYANKKDDYTRNQHRVEVQNLIALSKA